MEKEKKAELDARNFIRESLGGNMNISTLTLAHWAWSHAAYARKKPQPSTRYNEDGDGVEEPKSFRHQINFDEWEDRYNPEEVEEYKNAITPKQLTDKVKQQAQRIEELETENEKLSNHNTKWSVEGSIQVIQLEKRIKELEEGIEKYTRIKCTDNCSCYLAHQMLPCDCGVKGFKELLKTKQQ